MKDEECMFRDFLKGGLSLSCLVIHVATFSFAILYIMTRRDQNLYACLQDSVSYNVVFGAA